MILISSSLILGVSFAVAVVVAFVVFAVMQEKLHVGIRGGRNQQLTSPLRLIYIHRSGFRFRSCFRYHSCSWQVGLEFESDPVYYEKFYVVNCSHLFCSLNQNQNLSPAM